MSEESQAAQEEEADEGMRWVVTGQIICTIKKFTFGSEKMEAAMLLQQDDAK